MKDGGPAMAVETEARQARERLTEAVLRAGAEATEIGRTCLMIAEGRTVAEIARACKVGEHLIHARLTHARRMGLPVPYLREIGSARFRGAGPGGMRPVVTRATAERLRVIAIRRGMRGPELAARLLDILSELPVVVENLLDESDDRGRAS